MGYNKIKRIFHIRFFLNSLQTGSFSFVTIVLFAFNRLVFRDIFLENFDLFNKVIEDPLVRLFGVIVLLFFTLILALFLTMYKETSYLLGILHYSFQSGHDFLYTGKKLYSIYYPARLYLFLGIICYFTNQQKAVKVILYIIGLFYVIMYCITGFTGYFLAFWSMSCCQKYCKFVICPMFPKGILTLTKEEYVNNITKVN